MKFKKKKSAYAALYFHYIYIRTFSIGIESNGKVVYCESKN